MLKLCKHFTDLHVNQHIFLIHLFKPFKLFIVEIEYLRNDIYFGEKNSAGAVEIKPRLYAVQNKK